MSFLTGQDWTPKFAGQVLLDQTESQLIFLNILPNKKARNKIEKKFEKKDSNFFFHDFCFVYLYGKMSKNISPDSVRSSRTCPAWVFDPVR